MGRKFCEKEKIRKSYRSLFLWGVTTAKRYKKMQRID